MKKLIFIILLLIPLTVHAGFFDWVSNLFNSRPLGGALSVLRGNQGGTGVSSTIAGNVGTFLQVASTSPNLTYTFAAASGGSGSISTSSNVTTGYFPFWASGNQLTGTSSISISLTTTTINSGLVVNYIASRYSPSVSDASINVGDSNTVTGYANAVFGYLNTVTGDQSAATGESNTVSSIDSFATGLGNLIDSASDYSMAFGRGNVIAGTDERCDYCFAIGRSNFVMGATQGGIAIGSGNSVSSTVVAGSASEGVAIGTGNSVKILDGYAIGWGNTTGGGNGDTDGMTLGVSNSTYGDGTYAFGRNVSSTANNAITIGVSRINGTKLINNISNSIALGASSTVPTIMILGNAGNSITGIGKIGIGTSTPQTLLHVGSSSSTLRIGDSFNPTACLEMQDMSTSVLAIRYMYISSTAWVVTSTKPNFCM